MEFPFDINIILPYEITILNGDYRVLNEGHSARITAPDRLSVVIDAIGEASFQAQGLPGSVTTSRKFRISDQRLYLVKNVTDNKNHGSVVGLLKVGAKHLYVYDSNGQVHERTPLCVLDFYVHESKQRSGYGKRLFDAMLQFEKCTVHDLAIDRPSSKCLAFLHKHFSLSAPIHQVNNFVVYSAFFNRSPVSQNRIDSFSKRRNEILAPVDNFRRRDSTSWLMPSEQQNRRPWSEQNDPGRMQRTRTVSDENLFTNHRQATILGASPVNEVPKQTAPFSAYSTSYGQHYNPNSLFPEQKTPRTNAISHSAPYVPRSYTNLFSENNPFPSLQRYNTNPTIQPSQQSNVAPSHTFKEYQSSMNDFRRGVVSAAAASTPVSQPATSLYTFPSLVNPKNNWHMSQHQRRPIAEGSASSTWNLFGVHRLL